MPEDNSRALVSPIESLVGLMAGSTDYQIGYLGQVCSLITNAVGVDAQSKYLNLLQIYTVPQLNRKHEWLKVA